MDILKSTINNLTPQKIVIASVIFTVIYYLIYTYLTKDNENNDIDYTCASISLLLGFLLIVSLLIVENKVSCPKEQELMKQPFYE